MITGVMLVVVDDEDAVATLASTATLDGPLAAVEPFEAGIMSVYVVIVGKER